MNFKRVFFYQKLTYEAISRYCHDAANANNSHVLKTLIALVMYRYLSFARFRYRDRYQNNYRYRSDSRFLSNVIPELNVTVSL